jgi:hypothetical protein
MRTVSPMSRLPPSGCSCPVIMRKSVVLPAPFGPMIPTMPPGGSENETSSNSSVSPKAFESPLASTTLSPSRGASGMRMSAAPPRFWMSASSATSCS